MARYAMSHNVTLFLTLFTRDLPKSALGNLDFWHRPHGTYALKARRKSAFPL